MTGLGVAVGIMLVLGGMGIGAGVASLIGRSNRIHMVDQIDQLLGDIDGLTERSAMWRSRAHQERDRARRLARTLDVERAERYEAARNPQ